MRALKILVVVMGVLIVLGTVALGWALVKRLGGPGEAGSLDWAISQPAGTRILGVAPAEGGLALLVQRPDGERLLLLDTKRKRVLGEIRIAP